VWQDIGLKYVSHVTLSIESREASPATGPVPKRAGHQHHAPRASRRGGGPRPPRPGAAADRKRRL